MSEYSNINNTLYEFELSLIDSRLVELSGAPTINYIPINKGAVSYMEIEDSLSNYGYVGYVEIQNFYDILQRLNILNVNDLDCMYIGIRNRDPVLKSVIEKDPNMSVGFLSLLTKGGGSSTNIVNKTLKTALEEYYIARLKQDTIRELGDKPGTYTDTPGNLIYKLLNDANKLSVDEDMMSLFDLTYEVPMRLQLSNMYGPNCTTIYDLVNSVYKYTQFANQNLSTPAFLSLTNTIKDGIIQRKFTLKPIAETIFNFYPAYRAGETQLAKYVTEEFTIGSAVEGISLNTNFIDTYDLMNVDRSDVLTNKWVDYIIADNGVDITTQNDIDVSYDDVRYKFATGVLAGIEPNLPKATVFNNRRIIYPAIHTVSDSYDLTKIKIEGAMFKSFILDNQALNFTVPGNIYRQSGKFIRIYDTTNTVLPGNRGSKNKLDGYWFVITVKHIFKGDYYTNEYVCVKLHKGDNTNIEPLRSTSPSTNQLPVDPNIPIPTPTNQTDPTQTFRNNPTGTSVFETSETVTPLDGRKPDLNGPLQPLNGEPDPTRAFLGVLPEIDDNGEFLGDPIPVIDLTSPE